MASSSPRCTGQQDLARLVQQLDQRMRRQEEELKTQGDLVDALVHKVSELVELGTVGSTEMPSPSTAQSRNANSTFAACRPGSSHEHSGKLQQERAPRCWGLQQRLAKLELQVCELRRADASQDRPLTPKDEVALQTLATQTVEGSKGAGGNGEDGHRGSVVDPGVLTPHRLDAGDMYEMSESIWDDCMFVGLSALGPSVSLVMILVYLLNLFIQAAFCLIVWQFMLEPDVHGETLDGLLRFRAGLAHSVLYADTVLQRSMAAQICNTEDKLHMSGAQRSLYKDSIEFSEGGPLLSLLAQMCWMGSIVKEVNSAYCFARSVVQLKRGRHTEVVTADSTGDDFERVESFTKKGNGIIPAGSLVAITVVTRITKLGAGRLMWCIFAIAIPRAVVAICLGIFGTFFLAKSARMEDLVLNAIALAFILDLDELLHSIFAPRRVQTLMNNIEPLPMPPLRKCVPGLNAVGKILLVAGGVYAIKLFLLDPFFWRLRQAQDILCSGDVDFVYATNPATGMVHVTKTRGQEGPWTEFEKTILQVAKPTLESRHGWAVDQELVDLSQSGFSMAVVTQWGMDAATGGVKLADADPEEWAFLLLKDMGSWTVAEMTEHLPCTDMGAGNSYEQAEVFLQRVTGISNFSCAMLSNSGPESTEPSFQATSELCSASTMTHLRALCPESCGCHLGVLGMTGLYGSREFGCPLMCTRDFLDIRSKWFYYTAIANPEWGWPEAHCQDAQDWQLVSDPATSLWCLMDFEKCLELEERYARWYAIFVRGIYGFVAEKWGAGDRLAGMLWALASVGLIPSENPTVEEFVAHFWEGGLIAALVNGEWKFHENVPHPRGLTGCRFLASYELTAILGIDLCSADGHRSIREICPVSCGCSANKGECPAACTEVDFEDGTPGSQTATNVTTGETKNCADDDEGVIETANSSGNSISGCADVVSLCNEAGVSSLCCATCNPEQAT